MGHPHAGNREGGEGTACKFGKIGRTTMKGIAVVEEFTAKGKLGGRPFVVDAKKRAPIEKLARSGDHSRDDIASMVGISSATLYR